MTNQSEEVLEFLRQYQVIRPRYENLVDEVKFALTEYVKLSGITTSEILGRAKSRDSFAKKISRKGYKSPFSEMKDLAASRVVCLFESDLEKVKDLVQQNFEVLELEDKSESLGDSLMGYQGYHLIVRLGPKFKGPRYDELKTLYCEIQIRTVLQDAWSKISHQLVYKSEASVPKPFRRSLNNVSALMEIAQSTFDTVKVGQEKYTDELRQAVETDDNLSGQEINHHTLMEYSLQKFPELTVSDYWQDRLIADINLERYKTIGDLDVLVSKALPHIEGFAKRSPRLFKHSTDFITKSLGLLDEEFFTKHSFGRETSNELKSARRNI